MYTYISILNIYIYPPPCPEARDGVFIMCLRGPCHDVPGWNEDCLREPHPPPGMLLHDFLSCSQLLIWSCFLTPLRNLVFPTFDPRSLPKWSPNGPQIRRKLVPTTFQKNIHKTIRIFSIFNLFRKGRCSRNIVKHNTKRCFS